MKPKSIMLAVLLLAVLFAGCVGDQEEIAPTPTPQPTPTVIPSPTPTPQPTPEPTPTETVALRPPQPIYLDKYALTPRNPTIRVGEALNWINIQRSPMTDFKLVSEDGLWEDQTIGYGKKFKYTFDTSGNYTYYCPGYGSSMRGTVTVVE